MEEPSGIYYNVDQFYNNAWLKLILMLTSLGAIGATLFNKYTNTVKAEIENGKKEAIANKKEIIEYTDKRIKDYEELIKNYRKITIENVKDTIEEIYKNERLEIKNQIKQEEEKLEKLLIVKSDELKKELQEQSEKNKEELKIEFKEFNYINNIKLRMNLYKDKNNNNDKIIYYERLLNEVIKSEEIKDDGNKNELLSALYFSLGYLYSEENDWNNGIKNYQKTVEIKPDMHEAYYNWGTDLGKLADFKEGNEKEELYKQAFEKLEKSVTLGGKCYNLACLYALRKDKKLAFETLDKSLERKEVTTEFVSKKDTDWKEYWEDGEFKEIIKKYEKIEA